MLVAPEAASLFGAVVTLSMATTPFLMMIARGSAPSRRSRPATIAKARGSDGANRADRRGYGRFGQTVGQMLIAAGHSGHSDRQSISR
jgi:glutathione-regulated potassium-efflux system protein KefB